MKTTIKFLLAAILIILMYSCSNDTVINTTTTSGPYTLSGNIENWNLGGNIKLKAELYDSNFSMQPIVLDSTTISNSGAFSLKFNVPHDSLLYPITFNTNPSCIVNVTLNPPSTKSSYSVNLVLYNDSILIGYIYRSNYMIDTTPLPGQFLDYNMYLNQNVSITGSVMCNNGYYHDTTIYEYSGARGWNNVVVLYNSYTANSMNVTVTANEPAGGKWFARAWTGDAVSAKSSFMQRIFIFNKCITCK